MRRIGVVAFTIAVGAASAVAQETVCEPGGCAGDIQGVFLCGYRDVLVETGAYCVLENCQTPQVTQLPPAQFAFTQLVAGDEAVTNQVRVAIEIIAPWNNFANDPDRNRNASPNGQLDVAWYRSGPGYPDSGAMPPPPWTSASDTIVSLCEDGEHDKLLTGLTHKSTCAELHDAKGGDAAFRYGFRAQVCGGPCPPPFFDQETQSCPGSFCGRWKDFEVDTTFDATAINGVCPEMEEASCSAGSTNNVTESGDLSLVFFDSGPGAIFRYRHGGVGWPGAPEEERNALGQRTKWWQHYSGLPAGWSHDYALTLVPGREPGHTWLITESGTYRSFWDVNGDDRSDFALPSDDERYLEEQADGTIHLIDVDGSRQKFSGSQWIGWEDANGNRKTATFPSDEQMVVTMPDGRQEIFQYLLSSGADGPKTLVSLTEVGVDGIPARVWRYPAGMSRIEMPDGRHRELRSPASDTLANVLVGLDGGERIEGSWRFDSWGNVIEASVGGGSERLTFVYDKPWNPRQTRVTDAYGVETVYKMSRDASTNRARSLEVRGCPSCGTGPQAKFVYGDPENPLLPTSIVDGKNVATAIVYDPKGQVRSIEEAAGTALSRVTTIERNGPFPALVTRVESESTSDISGGAVRESIAAYDAKGNPESTSIGGIEDSEAFTYFTTALFNAAGLPLSIDPPGNGTSDVVSFTYDVTRGNLLPLTRTDPLVGTTSFSYDALNRLATVVDVNNVATTFVYDGMDRLTELRRIGAGATGDLLTTFEYAPLGDLLRVHRPEGNLVEYGYDVAGRVVTVERKPDALTSVERTLVGYNGAGQVTSIEAQRFSGGNWQVEASTIYLRSSRCQLDAIRHADGTTTEFSYDCNRSLEKVWDANHPRLDFPNQPTATYSRDALGRLQTNIEPWAGGGVATTQFAYDVQDHLREVVDAAGHVTRSVWSDRDLLTSETSEFSGVTRHSYDEAGDLLESTNARGITASYLRDALGRVTIIDLPGTEADTESVFDAADVAFSKGRLTSIRRGSSVVDYRFDRFGRLTQEGELAYAYDRNSRRTEVTYPHGIQALYGFDHADRPKSLTLREPGRGNTAIVANALYAAMGPLAQLDLGNGVTEERSFDQRYLPTRIEARRGVANLLDWAYQTDGLGNVLSITDGVDASKSRIYGYQEFAYFLSSATGPWGSLSWEYSKIGDRLAETRDAARTLFREAEVTVAGVERKQRLIEPPAGAKTTFWFDPAGNQIYEVTGNRKLAFEYGNDNRLAKIAIDDPSEVARVTEIEYDGRGSLASAVTKLPSGAGLNAPTEAQRLRATYGGSSLFHRFSESLPNVTSSRPVETRQQDDYVLYFAGRPVAILSTGAVTPWGGSSTATRKLLYLTTDHLGTPVLATGEGGAELWSGGFEPFGGDHQGASAAGVFLRFPGQWVDETFAKSGLSYNLNRWYDNRSGRYTQADPIGISGGINTYGYAGSDPAGLTDPLGLKLTREEQVYRDYLAEMFQEQRRRFSEECAHGCISSLPETQTLADIAAGWQAYYKEVGERSRWLIPIIAPEVLPLAGGKGARTLGRIQPRCPRTGRFVPDPLNPPSPHRFTDNQRLKAWKAIVLDPNSRLTNAEREQVRRRGWRGPQRINPETGLPETMELSHEPIPLRDAGQEVLPRWPPEHAAVDPHRKLKKQSTSPPG